MLLPENVKQSIMSKNSTGTKFVNHVRGSITEQDPEKEADESMPISPMKSQVAISERGIHEEEEVGNLAEHIPVQRLRPKSSTVPRGGQAVADVEQEVYGNMQKRQSIALKTNSSMRKSGK